MATAIKLLATTALLGTLATVLAQDYCDSSLCDPGVQNIGCNAPQGLSSDCVDGEIIEMTDKVKQIILDEHNKYRNQVAKGEIKWLQSSSNMVKMDWDDDLAYLAQINANRCEFEHDACHNTKKYPNSGQNIATWGTSGTTYELEDTLKTLVQEWWDERKYANDRLMAKLWGKYKALHFTMLMRDKASRVGCGLIKHNDKGFLSLMLVCNYSYTNMIGTRVYKTGTPCSDCTTGCDSTYDALCNKDEPVDVS